MSARKRKSFRGFMISGAIAALVLFVLFGGMVFFPDRVGTYVAGKPRVELNLNLPARRRAPQHSPNQVKKKISGRGNVARLRNGGMRPVQGTGTDGAAVQWRTVAVASVDTQHGSSVPSRSSKVKRLYDPMAGAYLDRMLTLEGVRRVLEVKSSIAQMVRDIVTSEKQTGVDVECVVRNMGDLAKCRNSGESDVDINKFERVLSVFSKVMSPPAPTTSSQKQSSGSMVSADRLVVSAQAGQNDVGYGKENDQLRKLRKLADEVEVLGVVDDQVIIKIPDGVYYVSSGSVLSVNDYTVKPVVKEGNVTIKFSEGKRSYVRRYNLTSTILADRISRKSEESDSEKLKKGKK